MPDVDIKKLNEELCAALRKSTNRVSKVSFVGDYIFVYLRSVPKRGADELKNTLCDALLDFTAVKYSFFKAVGRRWVYHQEEL